ncbi:DNA cytosine methyltransferase, partial [Enterococcus cecorum]
KCIDHGVNKKIKEAFKDWLQEDYIYETRVINFKDYGANSSRTRTLVIGVRKDLTNEISVDLLYPTMEKTKVLKEVIGHLPRLNKMGEIYENDIYHNFKPYREDMRDWIHDVKPGHSAFENKELSRRPHRIINGEIVPNVQKNGDKYMRQRWDCVAPCIHTRNDIMASQNTVHPEDDRVFSIRELMLMMNIPESFKWSETPESVLNILDISEKKQYLKKNEMNIRQSIGEAIPTIIIQKIAKNIKVALSGVERKKNKKNYKKLQPSA